MTEHISKDILFISGTARSGTTAMAQALNRQPGMLIGVERYNRLFRAGSVTPAHFDKARFLDIQPGDSHKGGGFARPDRKDIAARFDQARVVGDKFPQLFLFYDQVFAQFPRARHIFLLRNPLSVAESYQARAENPDDTWQRDFTVAISDWNHSLKAVLDLPQTHRARVFVAEYEKVFFDPAQMRRLFDFLDLPYDTERGEKTLTQAARLNQKMVPRRDNIRLYVAQNADWARYALLCKYLPAA